MLLCSSILHEEDTQADHMKDGNEGKKPMTEIKIGRYYSEVGVRCDVLFKYISCPTEMFWYQFLSWDNHWHNFHFSPFWCIHSFSILSDDKSKASSKMIPHIWWSRASSFKWEYPLLSLMSSSSFLRLLPRLLVTSIYPFIFPSITCFRRQFLCKLLLSSSNSVSLFHVGYSSAHWL